MYIKENKMRQTITGNTAFIKKTVLPMTKQAGIKKVSVKILPAHLPDDKEKMEVSFDIDKGTNDKLLDLLKSKIGKKGSMKRKKLNLTVYNEDDLGYTTKKGKTVKVTHKSSGKELIVIDKPNVRKEYEKIGYFVGRKGAYEGKITEKKESAIDVAKRIVKDKQYEQGVDMQTANLILKIYNAYDKHPALQKKFEKLPLKKMAQNVWRFVK